MRFRWPSLLATAMLACFVGRAHAVTFQVVVPADGTHVGKRLEIWANTSERVAKVEARVDVVAADLRSMDGIFWSGELSLATLARGPKDLVLTAHPAMGVPVTQVVKVVRNDLPRLVVATPLRGEVARPGVHIVAECFDDDDPRGCGITIRIEADPVPGEQILASGRNRLDTTVSLARWEGFMVSPTFEARDGDNGTTLHGSEFFVDGSPRLLEVDRDPGIVDADVQRTVFCDRRSSGAGGADGNGIEVRDRRSGDIMTTGAGPAPSCAYVPPFLTRHGVFYGTRDQPYTTRFLLWDGATVHVLGAVMSSNTAQVLAAAGDFVSWRSMPTAVEISDLGMRTSRSVATTRADFPGSGLATINGKGEVVYIDVVPDAPPGSRTQGALYRSRADGVVEKLRMLPFDGFFQAIADDGVNTAYVARNPSVPAPGGGYLGPYQAYLYQPSGDELLSDDVGDPELERPLDAAGGWIAYYRYLASLPLSQLWVRSPSGVNTLVNETADVEGKFRPRIEALSPTGEFMFTASGRRMLSRAGSKPEMVSTSLGGAFFRGNAWFILMGRSLFHVAGTGVSDEIAVYRPPPDAGTTSTDAGTTSIDAGSVDTSGGGCSCRAAGRRGEAPLDALLACALLFLIIGGRVLHRWRKR